MNAAPNAYARRPRAARRASAEDRDRDDRDGAAQPHRRSGPVEQRGQRAGEPSERHPHPDVSAALLRDRGAQLRAGQRRRDEERQEQHDEPRERLRPADRDRADRVDHDHRRHQEQDRVQPAQLAAELRLLRRARPISAVMADRRRRGRPRMRVSPVAEVSALAGSPSLLALGGHARHEARQLAPRTDQELPVDPGQVRLHRRDAHEQGLRDLPVLPPLGDERRHPPLGPCELTAAAPRSDRSNSSRRTLLPRPAPIRRTGRRASPARRRPPCGVHRGAAPGHAAGGPRGIRPEPEPSNAAAARSSAATAACASPRTSRTTPRPRCTPASAHGPPTATA